MSRTKMRRRDGAELKGRFIKCSDARILESITLSEFNFRDISETPVAALDNTRQSLLHPPLHSSDELKNVIKEHLSLNQDLRAKEAIRPILKPRDYTADWLKQKERAVARRHGLDEDDDLDIVLDNPTRRRHRDTEKSATPPQPHSESKTSANDKGTSAFRMIQEQITPEPTEGSDESVDQQPVDQPVHSADDSLQERFDDTSSEKTLEVTSESGPLSTPTERENFIPVDLEGKQDFHSSEQAAVATYRDHLAQQAAWEAEAEELRAKAKAQGYEDGFKIGEEKGALTARQTADQVLGNFNELVGELEALKKNILTNTQENFYELVQAIAETILRKELRINPQAFADVIRGAITEHMADDQVKIRVHPDTFEQLRNLSDEKLVTRLVSDQSVKEGDFKLESQLNSVNGDLQEMIRSILEEADLQLFESNDVEDVG